MKEWYKDFIGVYENAFNTEYCNSVIKNFQNSKNHMNRQEHMRVSNHEISDTWIHPKDISQDIINSFNNQLLSIYLPLYLKKYSLIPPIEYLVIDDFKVQKTLPTEGYHMWHSEWAPDNNINNVSSPIFRVLVWTLYLNDVEEGGETEFLYQSIRIKPKKGTLCIFPPYFTHSHRGNPPLSGEKYIVTGWINIKHI